MRIVIRLFILILVIVTANLLWSRFVKPDGTPVVSKVIDAVVPGEKKEPEKTIENTPSYIIDVPYVSEAPEGDWSGSWVNACEEATIAMVESYYKGKKTVSIEEAKNILLNLFAEQVKMYGNDRNTDAVQTAELIKHHSTFKAEIKWNPTLEEIKNEILNDRPVITLHRGFDLKNPNIPFSPTGSSYHMLAVIGYDDATQEFITHDPGDEVSGEGYRYPYKGFMNSIHDYSHVRAKADGTPVALFTSEL